MKIFFHHPERQLRLMFTAPKKKKSVYCYKGAMQQNKSCLGAGLQGLIFS